MMGVVWAVVLLWPGTPPLWLLIVLLVAIGIGGPGSLIGFDFARTFNPLRSLGSANGVVNVGGFLASFVMMFLIGVVLDAENAAHVAAGGAPDLYALDSFRWAFAVQYVIVGIGVVFLVRARRRTRRRLSEEEGIEVAPLWVALMERGDGARREAAAGARAVTTGLVGACTQNRAIIDDRTRSCPGARSIDDAPAKRPRT